MNTQANATTQTGIQSQAIAPAALSGSRLFYWSVRRELWENRWIYLAPLAIGVEQTGAGQLQAGAFDLEDERPEIRRGPEQLEIPVSETAAGIEGHFEKTPR